MNIFSLLGIIALVANLFAGAHVPWLLVIFLLFPVWTILAVTGLFSIIAAGIIMLWEKVKS